MDLTTVPAAATRSASAGPQGGHVDPGAIALGDFIVTPAGDVADIRSRETAYACVYLSARDRTGRTDLWAFALGDTVELLSSPGTRAA